MRGEDTRKYADETVYDGSPPHARGRLDPEVKAAFHSRITPACAGKTLFECFLFRVIEDHPRMRGEDRPGKGVSGFGQGSPPHARGRPAGEHPRNRAHGITPACAGKTSPKASQTSPAGDHPRMRGEDLVPGVKRAATTGSPPHARGRQLDSPGNPAKSFSSLPVFFCSQPSPLGWFLRWVLGLGSSLWKQR